MKSRQIFDEFINRENKIFDVLRQFVDAGLEFVLVGGYAVSAYKHRFSTDADAVIKEGDLEKFEDILKKSKFKRTIRKELDTTYSSKFVRYESRNGLSVSIDLLINSLAVRQSGAEFSFRILKENSRLMAVMGTQKEITVFVPKKEVLIAMKLHSGRLTDMRDIAALSKNLDIKLVGKMIKVGDTTQVNKNLKRLISLIDNKGFVDSFKGVFMEKTCSLDTREIRRLSKVKL
ncbi:MAG: nucleotidyl transferase AbiEii/AbiGii toxin family protein [Candidatus Woesearchaeota archaeon]